MFSINLPLWLGTIIGVLAGGAWPKENEGDFAAVSDIWAEAAAALGGFSEELNDARVTMQEGLSGPTAEQFGAFIDNLQTALPQMQQGAQSLNELAMEVAENIQYAKLMMLSMLVVTAVTIAELAESVFGAAAIPAVEAAAEAVIESIASQLLKQVLKSAAEAAAIGTTIDVGIQLFQYLKYGKPWNWKQTVETAGLGALGGALGGAMGVGALRGLGEDIGNSLLSHMIQGAINGAVVTEVGNAINGGDANVGLGAAGGAIGGALGHAVASAKGNGGGLDPEPGGYTFKAPEFDIEKPGGEFGGGVNGGKDGLGGAQDGFSVNEGSNGNPFGSSHGGAFDDGTIQFHDTSDDASIHGGSVSGGSITGGSFDDRSFDDRSFDGNSFDGNSFDGNSFDGNSDGISIDSRSQDFSNDGDSVVSPLVSPSSSEPSLFSEDPTRTGDPIPNGTVSQGPELRGDPRTQPGPEGLTRTGNGRGLPGFEPVTRQPRPSEIVTESSEPRPPAAIVHHAAAPDLHSSVPHPHSETPPDERGLTPVGAHATVHHEATPPAVHFETPAPVNHELQAARYRAAQWDDAKVEIQQNFTDRFDYTTKTERVADEAEDHFQDAWTDRGILRSRQGLGNDDLSEAGQVKVLRDFTADAKAAFDKRFGTPGDRYDPATDHLADFHAQLETLSRELPARLDREALWESGRDSLRQRFDQAFDEHPVVAPRRELLGPHGTARIEEQKNAAWQRLEPELRKAFDATAAHTSPEDLDRAVSERFDTMMRDEVPDGIALHDRLLTEVSAGRAATGEEHSPVDEAIEKRITSDFESVYGKPFAPPSEGRPHEDPFAANDRWAQLKHDQETDWLPKLVMLNRELGPGFRDRFDTAVSTRAAPRAELGLNRERPDGNAAHGLSYDAAVGRPPEARTESDDTDVENPVARPPKTENAWLPGRDISDAGLERVQNAFARELATAFRDHFDGPLSGDRDRDDAWQRKYEALFARRLPELLDYEAAFERQLTHTSRDFDNAFEDWEEDFAGGGQLDADGLERVRTKFDEDVRDAYDQVYRAEPETWNEFGGPERAWQAVSRKLLAGTEDRFSAEEALVHEVSRAADRFDRLNNAFEVEQEHGQELGSAYRTETVTRYDRLFGDGKRDVADWLRHEKEHGDAFGSRLTDLSEQREAAAAEAERAEAERKAAEEAARAAAEDEQRAQEVHEEPPPPETGPEKLQRLTAEKNEKLDGDVQQFVQHWQEQGHGDAVIEQAAKSWTDTVNREFDSFHRGLEDTGRIVLTGRWEDKYDSLVDVGKSDQWIGVHKQVGDAMKVLDDGLKQRTEQWSGERYADWQREQLAGAGERLASRLRSELNTQLRYLQIGRVDSVAEDTRRQWTADAVTKGLDDVLDRLGRNIDTSPVLLASLTKLRTETVSALDRPADKWSFDASPEPDVSGLPEGEQWQQAKTELDAKYAQQLDFLAKLESERPDADAIYNRIIEVGRDRSREGDEEYERMLPDPARFRQAFDRSFDESFAPVVRARSRGSAPATRSAEQRWRDKREQLENSLRSETRLASKQAEFSERVARTEEKARDRWISRKAADQKIIEQALRNFRASQKRLFLGTYGRLDESGKIDVNASFRYQDAFSSLVKDLDKQLAAAVAQDAAEKAASAKYDDAVNAWRETHEPALSSFEPELTLATRHPSAPDAEYQPNPQAQFEAAFSAEAANASARHLNQLRTELLDAERSARGSQASYSAATKIKGAGAAFKAKLDLEGHFVDAMPKVREGIAEVVRTTEGLDARAAQALVKSSISRADAAFQRVSRRVGDMEAAERLLQRELDDVVAGTKALAEFQAAVSEQVKAFSENSAKGLPAEVGAQVSRWAQHAADAKFDQLLASSRHSGDERITALTRSLDETLTELGDRLAFEAGVQKATITASGKAAQIAEQNLRDDGTVLDADSVQRLQIQHMGAARKAAQKVREDLTAYHFDPGQTRQGIEEFDGALQHLVDGVQQQVLVEKKLTSALTDAGNAFAALTDAHDVPITVFSGAAKDYRADYLTTLIRTSADKPLDAPSWLDHESAHEDRFGSALHAQVRELFAEPAWHHDEPDLRQDENPWRKSTFSPEGPGAACVVAARSAYPAANNARPEWIKCSMSGILEAVDVHFIKGADVPVKHKYADRMVVLRGADEAESPGLFYTADEWQAFILGVKEGEFDDMAAGATPSEGARQVIALRDSKDPNGPKLILAIDAWSELLISIKAGERELPADMRDLLDERFH